MAPKKIKARANTKINFQLYFCYDFKFLALHRLHFKKVAYLRDRLIFKKAIYIALPLTFTKTPKTSAHLAFENLIMLGSAFSNLGLLRHAIRSPLLYF